MTNLQIVIYSRISLAEKDPRTGLLDTTKVEAQERRCRAWIESKGHTVAAIVRENSQSAWVAWKRKKFNGVVRQLKAGEFDGVVSYAVDRLTRHPKEMEALIDIAESASRLKDKGQGQGVWITTMDGEFDLTTDSGRHQARGQVANARYETERKSKRHIDANALRLEDGRPPQGGGRPFGFEADKETIRPAEAILIAEATSRYLSGTHLRTLVREWNEAGVLTARGGQWSRNTMTLLLRRWRNAGLRVHGDDQPVALAVWPAIVTRDQVEAVRHLLASRATGPLLVARKHLLSGIATCAKCGSTLQVNATVTNGTRYEAYRCRGGSAEVACSSSVRRDVVDEVVLDQAARILALPSSALVNREGTKRATALRAERAQMLEQTRALTSADLSKEFEIILARVAGFNDRVRVIDAELERLAENDALAALVADLRPLEVGNVATFTLPAGNRETVRARLDNLRVNDLGKLRRVLRSLVEVQLLPWQGTGKPSVATARQRIRVTEVETALTA